MKKLIVGLLVISLIGCGKKSWNKKYVYEDCMKEMGKSKDAAALFSKDKMEKICDCAADKTISQYKSESDAKKDRPGVEGIGRDCAMEVLAPK